MKSIVMRKEWKRWATTSASGKTKAAGTDPGNTRPNHKTPMKINVLQPDSSENVPIGVPRHNLR